jgi:hypothetical protein
MFRNVWAAVILTAVAASVAPGKEWAQKMFAVTSHDFGTVARGAKSEFAFEIQNLYEEDVHIVDVRSSCGCTTPTITKSTLKTWEKGAIIATLNTKAFLGQRSSTLTVVIDKPYYAEVPLTIAGYIHSEVDFQPGSVSFGEVQQGKEARQEITVTYRGRSSWQIVDVRSANSNLEVELSDPTRTQSSVSYRMLVRLKPETPAGNILDTLNLVTNDQRLPTVALTVDGRVAAPLTISPASLFLGVLKPGQKVIKQLVVTGKQPFRVLDIQCGNPSFAFKVTDVEKKVHLIPVTFTAGDSSGEIEEPIVIQTDLAAGGTAQCLARGSIQGTETAASTSGPRR